MRPREDVMDRLAAADPVRDTAQLSPAEQSDADALLARLVMTPPGDEADLGTAQRPRIRRWALIATGALCSVAAAFAAVNVLDSDSPGPGVIDRAVAAVSQGGSVYHVLERSHSRPVGLRGARPMTFYFEYWHTTGGRMHRKTFAVDGPRRGKLVEDMAGRRRPGRRGGPVLFWDARSNTINLGGFRVGRGRGAPSLDPYADPGSQLRALEQQGRLRLEGTTRVGDRTAYRLVSGTVPGMTKHETESVEFLVDSETYLPLAQHRAIRHHPTGRGFELSTRYLAYERLPLNPRTREELDLDPHPSAKCSPMFERRGRPKALGFPNPCAR
jgi:hypothetical protein